MVKKEKNSIVIDQKTLAVLLSAMQPIYTRKSPLDITQSILCSISPKELTIKATDLELSMQASCPIENIGSKSGDPEVFLIPGKRFCDITRELDGHISITHKHNMLGIESGSTIVALNIQETDQFPPFPERIENLCVIDALRLSTMIGHVMIAAPHHSPHTALSGVLIEINDQGICLTATDGHCLAHICDTTVTLSQPRSWLVPRRSIIEIKKIIELFGQQAHNMSVIIGTCGNQLVFSGESYNIFTKLLSDQFPEYRPILNTTDFYTGILQRQEFIKILKRTACLIGQQFVATTCSFDKDKLAMHLHNKEVGELHEKMNLAEYSGDTITMALYTPYLLSGLSVFSDASIKFFIKEPRAPFILTYDKNNMVAFYVVMPVAKNG